MKFFTTFSKKIATGFVAVLIAVTAVYAPITPYSVPRAHAWLGILDTNVTDIAKFALDGVAWAVAKAVVNAMTQSMVNWINSGFEGSPAFATNLQSNLGQVADGVAVKFFTRLSKESSINSPYVSHIIAGIHTGYLLYTSRDAIAARLKYDLGTYARDEAAFRNGQFNKGGGFNAWLAVTFHCGNDPYCAGFETKEALMNRIDAETQERLKELDWGKGFMSWKSCPSSSEEDSGGTKGTAGVTKLSAADKTAGCTIKTPGSVIESQLENHLGSGIRQLELADSINEIVGALASQLVSKVISSTGLLGTSQASSGGRSFLEQAGSETPGASLADGFEASVTSTRNQITITQSAWQTFRALASKAVGECSEGANKNADMTADATSALAQADAALVKTASSIAKLTDILARVAQIKAAANSSNSQSVAIQQVSNDYTTVLATANNGPTDTMTARMNEIVDKGCK